jgi:histidinol-phosphatase (PHP family)
MDLPADGHVHSEWSWDALFGSMVATCARAVELGLSAIAFTEHVDFTPFRAGYLASNFHCLVTDGTLTAPVFDAAGYLESVLRCRARYPELRILTGMEVGEPHRHGTELASLLAQGTFDRVLGSLHCLPDDDEFAEPFELFARHPASTVFREYLAEIPRMVAGSELFEVFSHIDYPVRSWPDGTRQFAPVDFEEELRYALQSLAQADRALEVNAKVPLDATVLGWWREEGGRRVTFGSDGHEPWTLGQGLAEVATMAEGHGFRPDSKPEYPWYI